MTAGVTPEQVAREMPAVGEEAPDFTLPDDTGTPRRLSEARGHWLVLFFYPEDDTPGCTKEACAFRDADERIRATDAQVWGVSVLGSGSKAAFKAKYGLPFTLLADEDHAVAERYGTWRQKQYAGKSYWGIQRSTFLIDREGRVARVWPRVDPDSHVDEVLEALAEVSSAS